MGEDENLAEETIPFDEDDPDQSAMEFSISEGLVLTDDDRWLYPDDVVDEFGAEEAAAIIDRSRTSSAAWLRRHGLDPTDYGLDHRLT